MKTDRIFGKKVENVEYYDRPGAYVIPIKDGKVAVVKLPKGLFLLGGKIEQGETDIQCIKRECMEEIGYSVYVEKKLCSAESYALHSAVGYFHPVHFYYMGQLLKKTGVPIEKDHELCWFTYEEIKGKMFSDMQNWALDQAFCDYSK